MSGNTVLGKCVCMCHTEHERAYKRSRLHQEHRNLLGFGGGLGSGIWSGDARQLFDLINEFPKAAEILVMAEFIIRLCPAVGLYQESSGIKKTIDGRKKQ